MPVKFGNKGAGAGAVAGKGPQPVAAPASAQGKGASLLPEDWTSGGGLANDIDVTLKELTFVDDWTYNGKIDSPVLALRVTMIKEDGTEEIQHLSAGDLSRFVPSGDGKRVVQAQGSTASALNDNTNTAEFIKSILDAGFPKNKVTDSVDIFEGMEVHVMRIKQKERSGLANQTAKGRAPEVLTVSKINRLPWEAKGKKTAAAAAAGPAKAAAAAPAEAVAAAASNGDGDLTPEAVGVILTSVLTDAGGSTPFKGLSMKALKHLTNNPHRADILAVLKDAEQLQAVCEDESLGGTITFDGETLASA